MRYNTILNNTTENRKIQYSTSELQHSQKFVKLIQVKQTLLLLNSRLSFRTLSSFFLFTVYLNPLSPRSFIAQWRMMLTFYIAAAKIYIIMIFTAATVDHSLVRTQAWWQHTLLWPVTTDQQFVREYNWWTAKGHKVKTFSVYNPVNIAFTSLSELEMPKLCIVTARIRRE